LVVQDFDFRFTLLSGFRLGTTLMQVFALFFPVQDRPVLAPTRGHWLHEVTPIKRMIGLSAD
jgi:hypothetical protein